MDIVIYMLLVCVAYWLLGNAVILEMISIIITIVIMPRHRRCTILYNDNPNPNEEERMERETRSTMIAAIAKTSPPSMLS